MVNWRTSRYLVPHGRGQVDGTEVLRGLDADSRPVVRLRLVDADGLYTSWVWDHQPDLPRFHVLPRKEVDPLLERLRQALPSPLPGETVPDALERAIRHGDLMDPVREQELAEAIPGTLLPAWLGLELNTLELHGYRPHMRVQPSPSTAQVPWEMMTTSGKERTPEMLDVSQLLPASLRNDPGRRMSPRREGGAVATAIDPVVPGFADGSELGSILGDAPGALTARLSQLGDRLRPAGGPVRRDDRTRERIAAELEDAARFIYVGHVTSSTHALDARMHLSDSAGSPGRAAPLGAHRPFTAADLVLGAPGTTPWRAPNRVALIACESGGETRFAEPTGLIAAFSHAGAEYVTATRWTLPTEAGLARYGLGDAACGMLTDAIVAIDVTQDADDPVAALGAWQREQSRLWAATGDPRYSPLIWAAFGTAWSPEPRTA